jgi:hypothetical protein
MESVYHIVAIRVNETSWAHVWRLRCRYLRMGYDTTRGDAPAEASAVEIAAVEAGVIRQETKIP